MSIRGSEMKSKLLNKILEVLTIIVFLSISITPAISGNNIKTNIVEIKDESSDQDMSRITLFTFGKTNSRDKDIEISNDNAMEIIDIVEELKDKIVKEPFSDETKVLKSGFIDQLYKNNLIPAGMSKDEMHSLLNPSWLNWFDKKPRLFDRLFKRSNLIFPGIASAASILT